MREQADDQWTLISGTVLVLALNQARTRFLWRYKLSFSILLIFNSSGKEEHLIMLNYLSVKLWSSQDTDIKQSTPSRELSSTFFFLFCFLSFLWGVLGNSHSALFCAEIEKVFGAVAFLPCEQTVSNLSGHPPWHSESNMFTFCFPVAWLNYGRTWCRKSFKMTRNIT